MEKKILAFLEYTGGILAGFFAGSAFGISLVLGVAFFVGNAVASPKLSSSDLEIVFDYVVGPVGMLLGLLGAVYGGYRQSLEVAVAERGSAAKDGPGGGRSALSGMTLAIIVTFVAGTLAWPALLIATVNRGLDPQTIVGVIGIPVILGLVAFLGWYAFKQRTPTKGGSTLKRQLNVTPPALTGIAIASSLLVGIGTLAAVSDWHPIFLLIAGLPLTIALFVMHLFSCLYFFRPLPQPMPKGPPTRPTARPDTRTE